MSLVLPGSQAWPGHDIASPDLTGWQRRVGVLALALSLLPMGLALVPGLVVPTLVPVMIILALGWWRKSGKLLRFVIGVGERPREEDARQRLRIPLAVGRIRDGDVVREADRTGIGDV